LFVCKIGAALDEARIYDRVEHSGTRGRLREFLIQELIKPLLPPVWEVSTGVLVDHTGAKAENQSGQENSLIYSHELIPSGILPVEACLADVEVKTALNAKAVSASIDHSRRSRSLATTYQKVSDGRSFSWPEELAQRSLYSVFALGTDLKTGASAEWTRVEAEHRNAGLELPLLFALCSVGVGSAFWYGGHQQGLLPRGTQNADGQLAEVIAFFSFLADYTRKTEDIKRSNLPLFLTLPYYLLP
jgi:hypothetical protein